MAETVVRRRLPGYATEMLDFADGTWEVKAHDLDVLIETFGENLLWGLARCFEACDRLMSLGSMVPGASLYETTPVKAGRDHFAAFLLAAGMMRELALAILALGGIRKRLTDDDALRNWYTLLGIAKRWNSDDYARVRNAIGFHLDTERELFQRGLADLRAEAQPLVLAQGDSPQHGHTSFPFGREIFFRGLWPKLNSPETRTRAELLAARWLEFEAFGHALGRDQTRVGALLQGLLVHLLAAGRATTPESRRAHHRARLLVVMRGRQTSLGSATPHA